MIKYYILQQRICIEEISGLYRGGCVAKRFRQEGSDNDNKQFENSTISTLKQYPHALTALNFCVAASRQPSRTTGGFDVLTLIAVKNCKIKYIVGLWFVHRLQCQIYYPIGTRHVCQFNIPSSRVCFEVCKFHGS